MQVIVTFIGALNSAFKNAPFKLKLRLKKLKLIESLSFKNDIFKDCFYDHETEPDFFLEQNFFLSKAFLVITDPENKTKASNCKLVSNRV